MKWVVVILSLLFTAPVLADKISEFPVAPSLIGPEMVPLVQGGADVRTTLGDVAGFDRYATNAALKAATGATGRVVYRVGFTAAGDGGAATYTWSGSVCSLNSGNGDNGSQVKPNTGTGCWIADFSVIPVNVKQFGAKGDCVTDDGPAFSAALSLGRPVYAPAGHYLISTGGSYSTVPVYLTGDGYEEGGLAHGQMCDLTKKGTYIVHTNSAISPFTLTGGNIRGSTFDNLAVLQQHTTPGGGWAPTAYAPVWALSGTAGGVNFTRIGLGGIYNVIDGVGNSARIVMREIRGQVFGYLFRSDLALDVSRAHDIHIWPFWSSDSNVMAWQIANTDIFVFRRQDGFMADDIFVLPARSCIRMSTWGPGTSSGIQIGNLNCDVAKYAIWADSSSIHAVLSVSHLWHGGGDLSGNPIANSNTIQIDGAVINIRVDNINSLLVAESIVHQTNVSIGSQVNIGTMGCTGFDNCGFNYSGGTPYAGTFPVIRDVSPSNGPSTYSISHPIHPQNASSNADSGLSSGVINANSEAYLFLHSEDQAWRMIAVANGGTYVVPTWASYVFLNGAVASATIKLPKSMLDGQMVTLTCDDGITALTVVPNDGSVFTLVNAPTTCPAGQSFRFKASLAGLPIYRTLK